MIWATIDNLLQKKNVKSTFCNQLPMLVDQTNHNVFPGMLAFQRCIVQVPTLGGSWVRAGYMSPGFCVERRVRQGENSERRWAGTSKNSSLLNQNSLIPSDAWLSCNFNHYISVVCWLHCLSVVLSRSTCSKYLAVTSSSAYGRWPLTGSLNWTNRWIARWHIYVKM